MAKKGQKFNKYSLEFKLKAIHMYLDDGLGYKAVARELGILRDTQVSNWVKTYQKEGAEGLVKKRGRPKKGDTLEEQFEELKLKYEVLKKTKELWEDQEFLDSIRFQD